MHRFFTVKKNTLPFVLALPFGIWGVWMFSGSVQPAQQATVASGLSHTIELREDGFYPDTTTILAGSTVQFTTTRDEEFWPASNLHPTHAVYPAFDPREPITPDESWSFQFNQAGTWRYHDHLAPIYTGTITVVEEGSAVSDAFSSAADGCRSVSPDERVLCFEETLTSVMREDGLEEAFTLLSEVYDREPALRTYCHGYTHLLGEEAYRIFSENGAIEFIPKVPFYCGAGFYHGFMETMLIETGDITAARDLCRRAEEMIGGDAKGACYHGIGHGLTDGGDPRAWGSPQAMIESGLALCERTGENEHYISRCASGVFNSLGIYFNNPSYEKYDVRVRPDDPYAICREQEKEYFKLACYEELDTTVFRLNDNDFSTAIKYAERIAEDVYAIVAADSLANLHLFYTNIDDFNEKNAIAICRSLKRGLSIPCLQGLGAGLVEFGPPQRQYETGLAFCQSERLSVAEQKACLDRVVPYVKVLYTPPDMERICREAIYAPHYEQYCQ